jgi:hypothetical protein
LKPAQIVSENKLVLHKLATSTKIDDPVEVSRFGVLPYVSCYPSSKTLPLMTYREDVYDYAPEEKSSILALVDSKEWHVNFADKRLFVAYAGNLFAQDEVQFAVSDVL